MRHLGVEIRHACVRVSGFSLSSIFVFPSNARVSVQGYVVASARRKCFFAELLFLLPTLCRHFCRENGCCSFSSSFDLFFPAPPPRFFFFFCVSFFSLVPCLFSPVHAPPQPPPGNPNHKQERKDELIVNHYFFSSVFFYVDFF